MEGKVSKIKYRKIRYKGKVEIMKEILKDIGMRNRREVMKDIFEKEMKKKIKDVVVIFVKV